MPAGKRPRSDHEEKLIGQRIRLRRRQMKMTQAELGAALNPRRTSQQIQKYRVRQEPFAGNNGIAVERRASNIGHGYTGNSRAQCSGEVA